MSVTILRQSTRIGDPLPVKEYPGQVNKSAWFEQFYPCVTLDQNCLPTIAGGSGDTVMPLEWAAVVKELKIFFSKTTQQNSYFLDIAHK